MNPLTESIEALKQTPGTCPEAQQLIEAAQKVATGKTTLEQVIADTLAPECGLPPPGWKCTRKADHTGPCAAVPTSTPETHHFVHNVLGYIETRSHMRQMQEFAEKLEQERDIAQSAIADLNQRLIDRTTGFMQTLGQQSLEIATLKRERNEFRKIVFDSHREAHELAIAMHRNYYMETAPHWEPLPEVPGLISQIDNMYAGVRGKHEEALHALRQTYVHNQNMHCFVTKGRLNDQLNEQTHVLRKALGIPETTAPISIAASSNLP